jgi:hypothetical protein
MGSHEVDDQCDDSGDQQQVNQEAGRVHDSKAKHPQDKQEDE